MTGVKVVLTYEDYALLPDDGRRYEIHDGELSVTPAPGRRHQWVVVKLTGAIDAHVTAGDLGEVYVAPFDVILADTTIVQPDLTFVAKDRLGTLADRGVEGSPTLAVEVISPYTGRIDRSTKLNLYARFGVPYYWIVDPVARTIDVYRLGGTPAGSARTAAAAYTEPQRFSDALADLPPFPGLTLDATSLWGRS
jgi:Uma2 family endonuclease